MILLAWVWKMGMAECAVIEGDQSLWVNICRCSVIAFVSEWRLQTGVDVKMGFDNEDVFYELLSVSEISVNR